MRKKIVESGMRLFLSLTIAFQIAYYIGLRSRISDVGMFYSHVDGGSCGTTPRDVADHFVCCVGLVHYFLFGYLYSVKKQYAEKRLHGKDGKTKHWVGVEIFCQLGIFLSYLLLWIDNRILCYNIATVFYWGMKLISSTLYIFLHKSEVISAEYAWVEQYGDIFKSACIIAPVLLMLLIYSIHFICRLIQFKRINCFSLIWAVRTVVFFLLIVLLAAWIFQQVDLGRWWHRYYEEYLP